MSNKIISQIQFEVAQIDQLFIKYADLLDLILDNQPSLVEITALASVLHSFYTGVEKIFLSIAKGIDKDVPTTEQWHRTLLNRMAETTPHRQAVLTVATVDELSAYLSFRHFYRHSYSFYLDWDELEKLVVPLSQIWAETKAELSLFIATLP